MEHKLAQIAGFFHDGIYYRQLFKLALPIAIQQFVTASLNLVAMVLIGQLGEGSVAAVGLANQVWFLLNLLVFGVVSGTAIFIAQLWGKRDTANIRKVVGISLKLSLISALLFWIIAIFFPEIILRVYTNDTAVIEIGSRYLKIFGWSYIFYSITAVFSWASRSTGNVRLPMIVSTVTLVLDVVLAIPLIFGMKFFGIPALGVEGAAIAGLISRLLECCGILYFVYRDPHNPIAASIKEILSVDLKFLIKVMNPVLPVILNEVFWSLGTTTYSVIYGHVGTIALASVNMILTIEQLAFVVFQGIGNATAIMVGMQIGKGDHEKAFKYAGRSLALQSSAAMLMGVLVHFLAGNILSLYKVDTQVMSNARILINILSLGLWIKASNQVIIIGILRSGGDTRFSLILDGFVIWLVGVPFTAAGAFLFGFPIYLVYALTYSEEIVKLSIGLKRYISRKWINDMTERVADSTLLEESV